MTPRSSDAASTVPSSVPRVARQNAVSNPRPARAISRTFAHVRAQQEQRDGQRHEPALDEVIHGRIRRHDARVRQDHRQEQRNHRPAQPRGPAIVLLQPDRGGGTGGDDGPKRGVIVGGDERRHGARQITARRTEHKPAMSGCGCGAGPSESWQKDFPQKNGPDHFSAGKSFCHAPGCGTRAALHRRSGRGHRTSVGRKSVADDLRGQPLLSVTSQIESRSTAKPSMIPTGRVLR